MQTVILCNRLNSLTSALVDLQGRLRFISLVETPESQQICNYLKQRTDTEELPRAELLRQRREGFRSKYLAFLGALNARNQSLHWWAMPFTNKNPILTPWCRLISDFLLIVDLLSSDTTHLVVVTDSSDLGSQAKAWGKDEDVHTVVAIKNKWDWRSVVRKVPPGGVLLTFAKTFWAWIHVRRLRPSRDTDGSYTVVTSVLHPRSFSEPGVYRDAYFGKVVDELPKCKEKSLIFGMFHERWHDQLPKLKALGSGVRVVPSEAFLTLWDLAACGLAAVKADFTPIRIRGPVEIDGIDLSCTMKKAIREARWSGSLFVSLRINRSAKRLAQTVKIDRCLYPYENRDWEKMLVLGIKSVSSQSRMVGYQHASITLGHTNFILAEAEARVIPLPDVILTTGATVKDWLERDGNYPPGMFKPACALRQGPPIQTQVNERPDRMTHVLVTLATGMEEYVSTLVFLEQAFGSGADGSTEDYDVRIRPHPSRPLESALEIAPLTRRDFYSPSTGSLTDDLQWADVVLYASTTVGLEAISLGIPAIRLDLGDFLDTDPMFGWDEFKWSVQKPSELVETIKQIEKLPNERFRELQHKGREYVAAYLAPVTPGGLRPFWEG